MCATPLSILADAPTMIADYAAKLTVTALLLAAVVAFIKKWIVPGWVYDQLAGENRRLREENQFLRDLGNRAVHMAAAEIEEHPHGGAAAKERPCGTDS